MPVAVFLLESDFASWLVSRHASQLTQVAEAKCLQGRVLFLIAVPILVVSKVRIDEAQQHIEILEDWVQRRTRNDVLGIEVLPGTKIQVVEAVYPQRYFVCVFAEAVPDCAGDRLNYERDTDAGPVEVAGMVLDARGEQYPEAFQDGSFGGHNRIPFWASPLDS